MLEFVFGLHSGVRYLVLLAAVVIAAVIELVNDDVDLHDLEVLRRLQGEPAG